MIRGNDFILNPNNLEEQFQLVGVSDWVDFIIPVIKSAFTMLQQLLTEIILQPLVI